MTEHAYVHAEGCIWPGCCGNSVVQVPTQSRGWVCVCVCVCVCMKGGCLKTKWMLNPHGRQGFLRQGGGRKSR